MPKGYIIVDMTVTNPGDEFAEYRDNVTATIAAFGGRYLVRGGSPALVEGDIPAGVVGIVEFESRERAMEWYNSAAHQKILPFRTNNATTRLLCVTGT